MIEIEEIKNQIKLEININLDTIQIKLLTEDNINTLLNY